MNTEIDIDGGETGANHGDAIAWVQAPFNAIMLLLLIGATFYHMQLGLQVVIEDYIGGHAAPLTLIILIRGALIILGLIAVLSVLRLMLT